MATTNNFKQDMKHHKNFQCCPVGFLVRSCLNITLIKCLKGHRSLGSLMSKVKVPSVSQ